MAGDIRVRMLLEANAQQARAETQSLTTATQQLSQGATAAGRAAAVAAPQIRSMGTSSQTAAQYAGQLTYQLNDIGMMMAMGQSPFLLMVQQGPQVVQVFDQIRRSGMSIGPAIAGAFTSMLNPASLATMAVIGIGAAAVQWFTAAEEEARSLTDTIEDLEGRVQSYESAVEMALTPMSKLRKEWGDQAVEVREIYDALADLERLRAMAALDESAKTITKTFSGLKSELNTIKDIQANMGAGLLSSEQMLASQEALEVWADSLRQTYGMTIEQASRVQMAIDQMSTAKGPTEFAGAVAGLRTEIMAVANESGRLPGPLLEAADAVITAELEARKLAGPLADGARSAEALARVDMASGIAAASAQAQLLAANLGISLDLARAITGEAAAAKPRVGFGLPGMADPVIGGAPGLTFGDNPGGGTTRDGMPIVRTKTPTAGAGRSGGGGGGASKERDAIKELIEAEERQIRVLLETDPVQKEILKNHEALAKAGPKEAAAVEMIIAKRMQLEDIRDRIDEIGQTGEDAFTGLLSGAHSFSDALSMVLTKLAEMAASDAWDILWGDGGGKGGFNLGEMIGGWLGGLGKKADGGRIAGPGGPRDDGILTWTSAGEYVVNARATAANLPLIEAINAGASVGQLMAIIGGQRLTGLADGGMVGAAAPSSWRAGLPGGATAGGSGERGGEARLRVYFDKDLNLRGEIEQISGRVAADVVVDGISTFSSEILPGRVQQIDANPRLRG